MKKVYYKGQPYAYRTIGDVPGHQKFLLYKDGVLTHFVDEHEVERRTLVKTIMRAYYKSIMDTEPSLFN
jgi:hypothetical protein